MEAMVDVTFGQNASYAAADAGEYDHIRLWQTPWRPMKQPTYILPPLGQGGRPETIDWATPSNASLPGFSAVCWYFGKSLAADPELAGVPIGLVGTFVGGTFIEQWIRTEQQAACNETLCGTKDLEHYKCGSLHVFFISLDLSIVVSDPVARITFFSSFRSSTGIIIRHIAPLQSIT